MKALDVYIDICCDDIYKPNDIFSSAAETCRTLIKTAEDIGVICEKPICIRDRATFDEIDYLSKNYFATRPKSYNDIPENIFNLSKLSFI